MQSFEVRHKTNGTFFKVNNEHQEQCWKWLGKLWGKYVA